MESIYRWTWSDLKSIQTNQTNLNFCLSNMASIPKLFRRKGHASNAQPLGSYDTTQGPESATSE